MGPVSDDERNGLLNHSPLYGKYEEEVDRESAFEMLQQGVQVATGQQSAPPAKGQQNGDDDGLLGGLKDILFGSTGPRGGKRDGIVQTAAKSAVRQSPIRSSAACWAACWADASAKKKAPSSLRGLTFELTR